MFLTFLILREECLRFLIGVLVLILSKKNRVTFCVSFSTSISTFN